MNVSQAEAITRLFPSPNRLVLPQGVIDLEKNIPPNDVNLIGSTSAFVVRNDLHPELKYLLAQVLKEEHSGGGVFQRPVVLAALSAVLDDQLCQAHRSDRGDRDRDHHSAIHFYAEALNVALDFAVSSLVSPLAPGECAAQDRTERRAGDNAAKRVGKHRPRRQHPADAAFGPVFCPAHAYWNDSDSGG
jgi:hypothetical protein